MWNVVCNIFYYIIALPLMMLWDAIVDTVNYVKGNR